MPPQYSRAFVYAINIENIVCQLNFGSIGEIMQQNCVLFIYTLTNLHLFRIAA